MKRTADLSTTLRSGRDDNFVAGGFAFPGKVRGTADPSASLGMTKEGRVYRSGCKTRLMEMRLP